VDPPVAVKVSHETLLAAVNATLALVDVSWMLCVTTVVPKVPLSCGAAGWLTSVGGGSTVTATGI
jgi:hypothetical protein